MTISCKVHVNKCACKTANLCELSTNLESDVGEHQVWRAVQVQTDQPWVGRVDETLHVATISQLIGQISCSVEVRSEVLIHNCNWEICVTHIWNMNLILHLWFIRQFNVILCYIMQVYHGILLKIMPQNFRLRKFLCFLIKTVEYCENINYHIVWYIKSRSSVVL